MLIGSLNIKYPPIPYKLIELLKPIMFHIARNTEKNVFDINISALADEDFFVF